MPLTRALRLGLTILAASPAPVAALQADTLLPTAVIFLDVGQGDAVAIRSPEGRWALYDAGPSGTDVAGQLMGLGVDELDYVFASHPHADHIGGMYVVLASIPTKLYVDNGVPHTTQTYAGLMHGLLDSSVPYLTARDTVLLLGSVSLRVYAPWRAARDHNNGSVAVLVEAGAFRALLTGDMEVDALNYLLDRGGVPRLTVLKAAHHGARDGVSPRWIDVTRPHVVVISVGAGNSYGHPDPWAVRYYARFSSIYRTDLHGRVAVWGHSDGSFTVDTEYR